MLAAARLLIPVVAAAVTGVAPTTPVSAADTYSAPVRVDNAASVVATSAAVATNAAGDAVAVWDHGRPGWTIYGARRPAGGVWSAPVLLTSDYAGDPNVVALASDGTAYFDAISRDDDGEHVLRWTTDGTVTDTGATSHDDSARVLAGVTGDVVAYAVNANHAITYAYAVTGASAWTSKTTIKFFGTSTVVLAPHHTYYVAYTPDTGGGSPFFRVRKVDGMTGSTTLIVRRKLCAMGNVTSSSAPRPYDIGAGPNGAAVLTWRCTSPGKQSIKALRIDAGGHPGRPVLLARSRRAHVAVRLSPPRVAFDGSSATVVYSRAIGGGRRNVLATTSTDGTHWTRPSVKAARVHPSRYTGIEGNLASTPNGAALYTYRDGVALYAIRRAPGGAFGAPTRLFGSSDLLAGDQPGAIAPDGTATVLQLLQHTRLRARTGPS